MNVSLLAPAPLPVPLVFARAHVAGRPPHEDPALVRVHPGVYTPADLWRNLSPWERYIVRVHAVGGALRDPVFCLESAAALLGLPLFDEPSHVHVLARNSHTITRGLVTAHAFHDRRNVVAASGLASTSVVDTVLDLARVLPPAHGLAVADAALRGGGPEVSIDALRARVQGESARRGARQLDWILVEATPLSESVAEAVSRAVILWLGYERPELQVEFRYEGGRDRADFYWRRLRTIGEADGYGKYNSSDPRIARGQLLAEKTREDRLRRHEHGFVRWDSHDPYQPQRLDAKLRAGGLIPIHLPNTGFLATLATNPRRTTSR